MKEIQNGVQEELNQNGPDALRFRGGKVADDKRLPIALADPEENARFQALQSMPLTEEHKEQREDFIFAHDERKEQRCEAGLEQPLRGRRPWGQKEGILRRVAEEMSQELGISISKRLVKTCWDEHRKREKDAPDDGLEAL